MGKSLNKHGADVQNRLPIERFCPGVLSVYSVCALCGPNGDQQPTCFSGILHQIPRHGGSSRSEGLTGHSDDRNECATAFAQGKQSQRIIWKGLAGFALHLHHVSCNSRNVAMVLNLINPKVFLVTARTLTLGSDRDHFTSLFHICCVRAL